MKTVERELSQLRHPPRNVRMHTDRQLAELRRSVEMFGQIRPLVIDEDGVILAGNGLFEALKSLGWASADCCLVEGLTENQKKKLMLADNKIYTLGVDDMAAFDAILRELGDDIEIPGYDDDLLRTLTANQSEIDDMLADYGSFGEQSVRAMQLRSQAPIPEPQRPAAPDLPQADTSAAPPAETPQGAAEAAERFIVCPRCGERIRI